MIYGRFSSQKLRSQVLIVGPAHIVMERRQIRGTIASTRGHHRRATPDTIYEFTKADPTQPLTSPLFILIQAGQFGANHFFHDGRFTLSYQPVEALKCERFFADAQIRRNIFQRCANRAIWRNDGSFPAGMKPAGHPINSDRSVRRSADVEEGRVLPNRRGLPSASSL